MGTPIPKVDTEMAVKSCTSECSKPRPMTEEEIRKYGIANPTKQKEINSFIDDDMIRNLDRAEEEERFEKDMKKKSPNNEELAEFCKSYKTVYAASKALAEERGISRTTTARWINEAGIKFDKNVSPDCIEVEVHGPDLTVENPFTVSTQPTMIHVAAEVKEVEQQTDVKVSLKLSTYVVGQVAIQIDFESKTIKFLHPDISFKEAAAVVELFNDVL